MMKKLHGASYGVGLLAIVLCLLTAASLQAQTLLYWNAPLGGSGAWDTVNTKWTTSITGPPDTIWNNGAPNGDDAVFGGSSDSTITIDAGGISVHNITDTITTGTWPSLTITGSQLTLVGTSPTITAPGTGGIPLDSVVAGSSGLVKKGAGYLDLFANNTYTGVTDIAEGWVDHRIDGAFC